MVRCLRHRREEIAVNIEFIASVAVIAADPPASRRLYVDAIGLPLQSHGGDDYVWTDKLDGAKHFGVWPLSQAAEACFGTSEWPADRPVPQVSIEFELADVASVRAASEELEAAGHALLHPAREEPWGQTVARLLSSEGSIVGICFTPSMH
jgi:catechol 2,3-dioxygenase-like lactoylglutathione lyase family enzyme